jgi:hypothetical protein
MISLTFLLLNFERFRLGSFPYIPGNVKLWKYPGKAGGLPLFITGSYRAETGFLGLKSAAPAAKIWRLGLCGNSSFRLWGIFKN